MMQLNFTFFLRKIFLMACMIFISASHLRAACAVRTIPIKYNEMYGMDVTDCAEVKRLRMLLQSPHVAAKLMRDIKTAASF